MTYFHFIAFPLVLSNKKKPELGFLPSFLGHLIVFGRCPFSKANPGPQQSAAPGRWEKNVSYLGYGSRGKRFWINEVIDVL